ncbi:hypothetical protein [Actinocrinis sp.]|uniref:hypothetical protein n=1 Tax=Actinocrinis sp. TaxID=1920516 RepID=UPI002D686CBB|nr:hypothetical protein [Actinocrinis sp.]HZP53171.1 hypothetical protein [Actinocrinis sp.]
MSGDLSDHRLARSSSATSGGAATADTFFQPREPAWFRARLTLRLAVPLDRGVRAAAWRVAWSAALVAPPITVMFIAPAGRLAASTLIGLLCCALPGAAALIWSAAAQRDLRRSTARGLRQAGAEHRTAWLIATGRLALFAGAGAVAGSVGVALLHAPIGDLLSRRAPLHGMFGAGVLTWLVAILQTAALAVAGALTASSPVWQRVDVTRFSPLPERWLTRLRRGR